MKTEQYKAVHLGSNEQCVYTNDSNEKHVIYIEIYLVSIDGYLRIIGRINDNWYDDDGNVYKTWMGDLEELFSTTVDFQQLVFDESEKSFFVEEDFLNTKVCCKQYGGDNTEYNDDGYFVTRYFENYVEMIHEIINK